MKKMLILLKELGISLCMSNSYLIYWSRVDSTAHRFLVSAAVSQSAEKLQGVAECYAEVAQVFLRGSKSDIWQAVGP